MVFSPHQDDEANMANAVIYSRAKQGANVYVIIGFGSSPNINNNKDEYGLGRLRESAKNLQYLGLSISNLLYLGYQKLDYAALGEDKSILTNNLGEILKKDNTSYITFSHKKEGFPSFHSVKYGNECTVSEEHLLSDIIDILQQYKPDEIYSINYDLHVEHVWLGSLIEQAMGLVKLRADFEDYCPRFYQSMSYQSAWYAAGDMMSVFSPNDPNRNILESTLPFKPWNPTFEWSKRVRFPVEDSMSIPDVNSNLSTLAYKSGFGKRVESRLLRLVNGDQIFWERDTRSKSYGATVSVSSNDADKQYLNDFSTTRVPFKNICKLVQKPFKDAKLILNSFDCYKWSPEKNDTNRTISLEFKKPLDITSVRLYDDFMLENQILSGVLTFTDGSSVAVGALNNCGSASVITFPTKKGIRSVNFQIKEYKGTPGLTEFEIYTLEEPKSPDFIQIYLSGANDQNWKTRSFLYNYPVDVSQHPQSLQLGVYRYPNETPMPNYKWKIVGPHDGIYLETNGFLRVEQSTLPGTYTVKVSENDLLTDTIKISVINNSTDSSTNKTDMSML
jgi:LmbE family N-acetylglucosaminyl deacetylase